MQDKAIYHEGGAAFVDDESGEIREFTSPWSWSGRCYKMRKIKAKNGRHKLSCPSVLSNTRRSLTLQVGIFWHSSYNE